jgi:iron complex outermembrane receptor protein
MKPQLQISGILLLLQSRRFPLLIRFVFGWLLPTVIPHVGQAQEEATSTRSAQIIPEIIVVESANRVEITDITPGTSAAPVPDAMEILTRMPGANVNRNGPLSGQAQYRGLFGPRMTVTVDGMRVTPGGPNWMDAPLHYMPAGLTDRVTMTRGIAPVSAGPGIGGLIQAESKRSGFASESDFQLTGDAVVSLMSNDGSAVSGFVGLSNATHRFHVVASGEDGDAIESGDGIIGATDYGRTTYGAGYGYQWSNGEVGIDISHTDTDPTGTPALPLDIAFFDTDRINAEFQSQLNDVHLSLRVFYTDIEHGMNNYSLRDTPDFSQLPLPPFQADDKRFVDVDADATGFILTTTMGLRGGQLNVGADGNFETHTAVVVDPDFAPFFVNNFDDAGQDQLGLFAEWFGDLGQEWSMEVGARYLRVESDSGAVDAFPARLADMNPAAFPPGTSPFAVKVLRDRFNALHRDVTDDNVDLVLKFDYQINEALRLGFGYGHKTRSPMYVERYLWIPLEINSGLGDSNNYVGNVNLDPEISDQLELSLEWTFTRGYLSPQVFYRSVDDFIQGVASKDPIFIAVSGNANGDPTPMEFTNVEAELYGFDVVGRYRFSDWLRLDAIINYVRGKRTDVDDNLFRVAPLNGRIALTAERGNWSVTAESVLVAEQDKIARTIVLNETRSSNAPTPGYGLLNLYGQWDARDRLQIRIGVENVLDKQYTNHLAGFNRVTNSDVPFGVRVPGPGINAFGQVRLNW